MALNDVSHEADSGLGLGGSGLGDLGFGGSWFFMLGYDRQGHHPVNYGCLRKCKNDKLYAGGDYPALSDEAPGADQQYDRRGNHKSYWS